MRRLWIVEAQFRNGEWDICDFTPYGFAETNFYDANKLKRMILQHLSNINNHWTKNKFRIVEYKRGKK